MNPTVNAYAAKTSKAKLEPFSYEPAPLQSHEATVRVKYCGVCHRDIAMVDNDWGFTTYPLVPGHEVVGEVTALGADVHGLKVGETVGVGWQSGSCAECEWCRRGKEHLGAQEKDTVVGRHGGYARSTPPSTGRGAARCATARCGRYEDGIVKRPGCRV